MKNYYICIDIGGTDVKFGIIDEDYEIIYKSKIKSSLIKETESFTPIFKEIFDDINKNCKLKTNNAKGIGIGFPGLVDHKNKQVKFLANLKLKEYNNILDGLHEICNLPIKIANDAELALLAEQKLGAGQNKENFVLLTLGTGLGCGIVLNGKPLRHNLPYSCECGHLKTMENSVDYGSLTSTRALIMQTKTAMQNNPNSKMWSKYNLSTITGKTVFDFKDIDKTAKQVFDNYIKKLGTVITNLYTLLSPEIFIIGGGISKQGEALTKPLEDFVNKNIFVKNINISTKIVPAKLSNDAGILGARCLFG